MIVYVCVIDGIDRYVGITNNFIRRRSEHISKCKVVGTQNPFYKCLNKSILHNKIVEWKIVGEFAAIHDAELVEISIIKDLGRVVDGSGILLNVTSGGRGRSGMPVSRSTKEKLRKSWTPERRLMYSENFKKMWTQDMREAVSNRMRGDKGHTAKVSWDFVKMIRDEFTGKHGEPSMLVRKYGVSMDIICGILHNTTWKVDKIYWNKIENVRPKGRVYTKKITSDDVIHIRTTYKELHISQSNLEIIDVLCAKYPVSKKYCRSILSNKCLVYIDDTNWWGWVGERQKTSKKMIEKIINDLLSMDNPNIRKYSKSIDMKYHTVYRIWSEIKK